MKNFIQKLMLVGLLVASGSAMAQTKGTVTGIVQNGKDKTPVEYASIAVKKLSGDSAIVGSALSAQNGSFSVNGLAVGKYRLYIAYLGLKSINKDFELTAAQPGLQFGALLMEDVGVDLQGVEIKGEIPPVKVKKDTLEFNASAFKVKENAVVEDVLKKLPGVEVSKDGSITTQGETIRRVRVDGKDFMGNDPLMATRNLPADMIDKIQIIDDMSEQSKFSGVDDGNREKIINITTRQDRKNGFFGNSTAGYGTDDRYEVNISVNKFKNDEQVSLIGQFNNINKQNFGGQGGGGGGRRMFGGGQQQGITTTNMAGLNYANVYKNGTTLNTSYDFNKTSLLDVQNSYTQNLLGNTITTNESDLNRTTDRLNHRFNLTLDTKIDSSISVRWQPNLSYTENKSNSLSHYNRDVLSTLTVGEQRYLTNNTTPALTNNLLIRKKFQRRGRTLSLNVNTNYNSSDADNKNYILDKVTIGGSTTEKLTNQLNDQDYSNFSNTSRLVYTEPLNKTLQLELNYQNTYSFDNQLRDVYNFNPVTQQFDEKDLYYSNEFENTTLMNAVGFSFNKTQKKYNWNVGLAVQHTDRKNVNMTNGNVYNQDFINLTPTANFRYTFSNSKRLNIRYNGRTNQPSISQIQPIPDNTNTQTIVLGNPSLKPSFTNNLSIFYNNFDFASFRSIFFGTFINQTFNGFSSSKELITDPDDINYGKIASKVVNVDGNFSANMFGNVSQPIIKGNKLTLQIDLSGSFNKESGYTSGLENITRNFSLTNGYKLVSNLDKLDMNAGIRGTIFRDTYSAMSASNTRYYNLVPSVDISYMFPGNVRIQTDVNYNKVMGRGANFDTDFTMVNAYISRQFFKNKGTFKFSVNDLLNQNTGITRNGGGNSIQDLNFNVLKRYYMLSFTYSLGSVGGRSMGGMQMPGMGGPRMRM